MYNLYQINHIKFKNIYHGRTLSKQQGPLQGKEELNIYQPVLVGWEKFCLCDVSNGFVNKK